MMVSECVGDSSDRGRCVSDCGACVRGGSYWCVSM